MIPAVVAAVVVVTVIVIVLLLRGRRSTPEVGRDAPAVAAVTGGLGGGLASTRHALAGRLGSLMRRGLDEGFWTGLEEALLAADVGVTSSVAIVERVRLQKPTDAVAARAMLREALIAAFGDRDRSLHLTGVPAVVVVVGVNGSGKTTTVAKLASRLQAEGKPALLGAGDTFRAAAAEQLAVWAERLDLDIVSGQSGADPASVAFDAYTAAEARGKGVVVVDTAGRLHSKTNLMAELGKVVRVLTREAGEIGEILVVLDGTTGQNGIVQAGAFVDAVGVTGAVVTKLDGTAKGGVAVAVESELGLPVKFIGVGERVEDLVPFDPAAFVDALLEGS